MRNLGYLRGSITGGNPGSDERGSPTISVFWDDGGAVVSVALGAAQVSAYVLLQQSDDLLAWADAEVAEMVSGEGAMRRWRLPRSTEKTR